MRVRLREKGAFRLDILDRELIYRNCLETMLISSRGRSRRMGRGGRGFIGYVPFRGWGGGGGGGGGVWAKAIDKSGSLREFRGTSQSLRTLQQGGCGVERKKFPGRSAKGWLVPVLMLRPINKQEGHSGTRRGTHISSAKKLIAKRWGGRVLLGPRTLAKGDQNLKNKAHGKGSHYGRGEGAYASTRGTSSFPEKTSSDSLLVGAADKDHSTGGGGNRRFWVVGCSTSKKKGLSTPAYVNEQK